MRPDHHPPGRPTLAYTGRTPHPNRRLLITLIVPLALLPAIVYGLRVLQTAPYRPPMDMNTLLDGAQIAFVRFLIWTLITAWLACAACACFALRRSRR